MSGFSRFLMRLLGWKFTGRIPRELKKYIIIVYPHTSYKDLLYGFVFRSALDLDIRFIGKAELFRGPFAWFFYMMGGQPVERFKKSNFTQSVVNVFNKKEELIIAMSPEGTRKRVEKFRTGFYYIAHGAGIPIVPVQFNAATKEVKFCEPFRPTGEIKIDMPLIQDNFRGVEGFVKGHGFL